MPDKSILIASGKSLVNAMLAEKLAALEGLISPAVGKELARLAFLTAPEKAIVEIGSYRGKSTCYLASGAVSQFVDRYDIPAHVFAVDHALA